MTEADAAAVEATQADAQAVAEVTGARPADSSAFIKLLSNSPKVYPCEKSIGHFYFRCAYTDFACREAVCIPEAILKGNACSATTGKMRGPFFDLNCALAFVVENQHLLPQQAYEHTVDYLVNRADTPGFARAPPLHYLDIFYSRDSFVSQYIGPRVVGEPDMKADVVAAIAVAEKRDRQEKQNALRAAKKVGASASAGVSKPSVSAPKKTTGRVKKASTD